ncbi:MAG: hypothetical protein Q8908_12425, partial [Bacteroidota bacterium]|nr:hypothetical protein [Bacteroidota bacterium]
CIGTDGFGSALIGAGSFGTGNLAVQAMNGNINNFGDIVGAFGQGAIEGNCLGSVIGDGLNVHIISTIIKGAAYLDAGVTALSAVKGLGQGIFTGDWSGLGNAGEIFLGNFALNDKLPGLGGAWEGISRFSWEGIQQTLGYSFNQCYNTFTHVDRVSYFDGATLVNRNGGGNEWGMTLGNFIMGNEMTANIDDETFMHEYGHTLQSQDYGPFYGLVIAPWSGLNMLFGGQRRIRKALSEHETEWYERQANGYAASYFGHYYNVSWEPYNYPIKKSDINQ